MIGFVSIYYYVDRRYDDNTIHNYNDDGDSFDSIRDEAFRIFPNCRIVSMSLATGNDPVFNVTDQEGSLSEFTYLLNGPSGQQYGDARIDMHLSTIGLNEE